MQFDDFIQKAGGRLSAVKLKILRYLWDASDSFPKAWVKSSFLLAETKQKYFDRRIRELRDEHGFDIETCQIEGEHSYRLKSSKLNPTNPRQYLTNTQKQKLFSEANETCQICGRKMEAGVRGLQADHKVPLIRGGSQEIDNWQAICNECNVVKRRACAGCEDNCKECAWAFPEKFGGSVTVSLTTDLYQKLKDSCKGGAVEMSKTVENILKEHFRKKSSH